VKESDRSLKAIEPTLPRKRGRCGLRIIPKGIPMKVKISAIAALITISTAAMAQQPYDTGKIFASKRGQNCLSFQMDNKEGPVYAVRDGDAETWNAVQASQAAQDNAEFYISSDTKHDCGFGHGAHKDGPVVPLNVIQGFYHSR
jgi:predicted lipoprotein with Yx(FWY)xxD motif